MGIETSEVEKSGYGDVTKEFYKNGSFLWLISKDTISRSRGDTVQTQVLGPFCSVDGCKNQLWSTGVSTAGLTEYECDKCLKKYKSTEAYDELRRKALWACEAALRDSWPVIAIDQPPTDLKARDEDDRFWIAARIGVKNGKRVGVVYFGEKNRKQTKKDYGQVFVDIEDEQLRHDPTNMNPLEVLVRLEADFATSSTTKVSKDEAK